MTEYQSNTIGLDQADRIDRAEDTGEFGEVIPFDRGTDAERVDVVDGTVLAVVDHLDHTNAARQDDSEESTELVESGEPDDLPSSMTWSAPDRASGERAPVIPPWLRSAEARKAAAVQAVSTALYYTSFHAVRTPLYATKTLGYSLVGVGRVTGKVTRWVRAEEGNYERGSRPPRRTMPTPGRP